MNATVMRHGAGIDDAFLRHDIEVMCEVSMLAGAGAGGQHEAPGFCSADAKVERVVTLLPVRAVAVDKPRAFQSGFGPGFEYPCRAGGDQTWRDRYDRERFG